MMTRAFLSTLSLSAAQNCAQNSGANRRDTISSRITDAFPVWARSWAIVRATLAMIARQPGGEGKFRDFSRGYLAPSVRHQGGNRHGSKHVVRDAAEHDFLQMR